MSERLSVTPSTTTESVAVGEVVELAVGANFFVNQSPSATMKNSQPLLPLTSANLSTTTMSSQATTMTTLLTTNGNGGSEAISSNSYDSMPTTGIISYLYLKYLYIKNLKIFLT